MKEIIKGAVVIDPAFRSKVTLVSIKKTGIFVLPFKLHQPKMVSLCKCTKPFVIDFASRSRDACLIIELASEWHTQQEGSCVNACQRTQQQFEISPSQSLIHAEPEGRVTATRSYLIIHARRGPGLILISNLKCACFCDEL